MPRLPVPGRHWSGKTKWDYTRQTTAGSTNAAISEARPNEHVLVGKARLHRPRRLQRAATRYAFAREIWTPAGERKPERFVVAHSFPVKEPGRIIQRVLHPVRSAPARLRTDASRTPICVHGFRTRSRAVAAVNFPLIAAPFVLHRRAILPRCSTRAPGNARASPRCACRARVLVFACPPSTHVELAIFHRGDPVRARAVSANGVTVDQAVTPPDPDVVHRLRLTGPEIIRVELDGGRARATWLRSASTSG